MPQAAAATVGTETVEGPHADLEALAFSAEPAGDGEVAGFEGDLAERVRLTEHLGAHEAHPGGRRIDQETSEPTRPGCRVGDREDHVIVGHPGVGDEGFAAFEHITVTGAAGTGLQAGNVGAQLPARSSRTPPSAPREPPPAGSGAVARRYRRG